jgi:hypothetical protein
MPPPASFKAPPFVLQLHLAATVPKAAVSILKAPHDPQAAWPPLPLQAASSKAPPPVLLTSDATTVPDEAQLVIAEEQQIVDKLAEEQKAAEKNVENLIEAVEGAVKKMDEMMTEKVVHLHAALVIHKEVLNGVAEQTRALQALLPEGKQIIGRHHATICDEEQQVHATFRKNEMLFDSKKEEAMMMMKEVVLQTYEKAKQEFEEWAKMVMQKVLIAESQSFFATQEEVGPHAPKHPPTWKAEPCKTWTGSVSGGATPSATALLRELTHKRPWSQRGKLLADACGEEVKEGEGRKKEDEEEEEEETEAESVLGELVSTDVGTSCSGIIGMFIPPALHQAAQPQKTVDATSSELVHGLAANNVKLEAIIGSLAVIQETHNKLIQQQKGIDGILHSVVEELKEQGGRLDDLASQHQRSGGSHGFSSGSGSGSFKMVVFPGDHDSSLSGTQSSNGTA